MRTSVEDTVEQVVAKRCTVADAFAPTHNSLNFLRIVLALTVMVSHSILLGGYADESLLNTNLSTIALYGFFAISGFLIAGSAARNTVGRYLWQRALRIFPAFWVCLVVTAFIIAGVAWIHGGQGTPRCSYGCYVAKSDGPVGYVLHNSALKINQQLIAGTPRNVPFGYVWNGPLWSLFYEFLCYLILAGLAAAGFLRRRALVLALTVATWTIEFLVSFVYNKQLISLDPAIYMWGHIAVLIPLFLSGSVLYLYREMIPDSGWIALGSVAVFAASLWWPFNLPTNRFTGQIGGAALWSPTLVYPLIWLGCHLPMQRVGVRNDYSYGIYIYAWPVQELLVMWHAQRLGYPLYTLLSVAITLPLAIASWWLVEKRALSLKKVHFSSVLRRTVRTATDSS